MSVYRVGGNKSSQNVFPSVRPTLDLDFANSKTLDPRITFTRASGGSYVGADGLIKYAGVNEARFDHDPSTGESLGLLIEEARTNLLTRSEEFVGFWAIDRIAGGTLDMSTTTVLSPDGRSFFTLGTYGPTDIRRNFSGGSGKTYTASCFYKQPDGNAASQARFEVHITGGVTVANGITYNFSTNSITRLTSSNNSATGGFQKYPNGVVRVWLTITDDGDGTSVFFLNLRDGFSRIDGEQILFWGAQIEEGSFPTSYIPTQASTRTRAADNASITGKNFSEWYRQDEGTIYCEVTHGLTNYRAMFYSISRGLTNNYNIQYYKEPLTSLLYNSNITNQDFIGWNSYGTVPYNKSVKTARSYIENNLIHSINGNIFNTVVSSAFGTRQPGGYKVKIPVELNRLTIGNHPTVGSSYQNGTIKRFTYYPKVLSPEQLIALTR
jgi:hypothetical protein